MSKLKPNLERKPEKSSRNHASWERQRKNDPVLQLAPLRDDLEWLLAGQPDPEISMDFFVLCSYYSDVTKVGRYLQEFWKKHSFTFLHSGWVRAAVGRMVLEDEDFGRVAMLSE